MAQKRKKTVQVNVRFYEDDLKNLAQCQELLGRLTQGATLRQLMLMYLGKFPTFPQTAKQPGQKPERR